MDASCRNLCEYSDTAVGKSWTTSPAADLCEHLR